MILGALKSKVQGDFQPQIFRLRDQSFEIRQGSQLGMNRFMTSLFRADGPRAAGFLGLGHGVVVFPFPVGSSDGMNGRQVKDVEAHAGDLGQNPLAVAEGSVLAGGRAERSRKAFIPGAEEGLSHVHDQWQLPLIERVKIS